MQRWTWITLLAMALFDAGNAKTVIMSNATCESSSSWSDNSMGQSPCLVAAYLLGSCTGGQWTVPALALPSNGQVKDYTPPNLTTRNVCSCSWAVYNLLSACAACQAGTWPAWPTWNVNCTTSVSLISSQAFPPQIQIPSGTVIPQWAAQDPQTWFSGTFNTTEAQSIGSQDYAPSDSSFANPSCIASTGSSSSSSTTPAGNSHSLPIGPIVGGVVGGVLGVLLIGVLAIFLLCPTLCRRRKITTAEIEFQHSLSSMPVHLARSGSQYDSAVVSPSSQQSHVPGASRPSLLHQFTPPTYPMGTSNNPFAPPLITLRQPPSTAPPQPSEMMNVSSSLPSNASVYSLYPSAGATPSIRSFFTPATRCHGHSHTTSDTSVSSASVLLPRVQHGMWRRNQADEVVPYILPASTGSTSMSGSTTCNTLPPSQFYLSERKSRVHGLQYTPEESIDLATAGFEASLTARGAPSVIAGMTDVYGALGSNLGIDRRSNMSPANASSILEAAPPYESNRPESISRRNAPRLPNVQEYPEEKSQFTNVAREM